MNKVELIGRLTKDPEIRYTNGAESQAVARFTLAVDRRRASQDGQREADFISCVCFGKTAEFSEKYLTKGIKIAVTGRIQTGSYTKQDGTKTPTFDVVLEEVEFCEPKSNNAPAALPAPVQQVQGGIPGMAQPQYGAPQQAQQYVSQQRQQYAQQDQAPQQAVNNGFMNIESCDEQLPFA